MGRDDFRKDLVRGSLIGGAIGDALGYAVEFNSYQRIISKYGPQGIKEYDLKNGVAEISDDTQMTLFTANGLLMGVTRGFMRGVGCQPQFFVEYAYQDWYYTQTDTFENRIGKKDKERILRSSWLSAIPELYERRAPGNTCMQAIREMIAKETPRNDSKGCGGVMRVAPCGLFCACHGIPGTIEEIDVAGGEIARLTHKHPLGWMPAMILTHILYRIVNDHIFEPSDTVTMRRRFASVIEESLDALPKIKVLKEVSELTWNRTSTLGEAFPNAVDQLCDLMKHALVLADNDLSDIENIRKLGEGWVGEEALAIAVYSVARHIDSFTDTIIAAVNHDGDSDSTGSIAGNIIGSIVGYERIPSKFKEHLELHDVILGIADDLHQGCIISDHSPFDTPEKVQWYERYCKMKPSGFR